MPISAHDSPAAASLRRLYLAAALSLALAGCSTVSGTVSKVTGKEGATTDKEARYIKPEDPLARPVQLAWTAARAKHCGFMFNPEQLKAAYLADEARRGATPAQMQEFSKAYDYTYASLMQTMSADPNYCNPARIEAVRVDLKRYLAGDFSPSARAAR
jgi:hypothetical protein